MRATLAILAALLFTAVLAQNPASFTVAILNRDFQGCQYAPIAANWVPRCSHWSDAQPTGSNPACIGNQNPDFEGFYPGNPYPRIVRGVVLPTLDPVDLVPAFNNSQRAPGNVDVMFHGKYYFDQWYRDVPGVNTQVMTEAVFTYAASDPDCPGACYVWNEDFDHGPYFPIDGKGYGNYCWYGPVGNALAYPADQVRAECLFKIDGEVNRAGPCVQHNFHFTDHLAWDFLLTPGSYIKFNGDDDTWIYVGSVLVIDLGGIDWTATFSWTGDYAEMIRLGLTAGNMYTLRWFHAQRKIDCSHHKMVTTLVPYCYAEVDGTLCGSQTGLPVCQARQCVLNQCVVDAFDDTTRCPHKNGAADGMPICTAQRCVGTVCNTTLPFDDATCPQRAVPAELPAQCNKWQCLGTQCVMTPWYYPGAVPQYPNQSPNNPTPEVACNNMTGHDAQCWRNYCTPDLSQNAPYGVGVCTGQYDNTMAAQCPPPVVNGSAVNPACYVPKCDPSENGKCSTEIITGGPGADPASHLGNCPIGTDMNGVTYDVRCFYPFCDMYGQCSGDVLSGMFVPFGPGVDGVYIPGWRNDSGAPAPEECGVPAQYDARCYLPACVGGHCGGWVLNGSEAWRYTGGEMSECPVPADKNSICFDPFCIDGVCSGGPINVGSTCVPTDSEVHPTADSHCVYYVCGDESVGEKPGSCVWRFYGNDTHCNPDSDTFCTAFLCGSGDEAAGGDGFAQGVCAQRPYNLSMVCAEEEHMCNHFECRQDPAAPNQGICMEVPNDNGSTCVTDDDACTNEVCVLDPTTGKGQCNVTTPVTCPEPLELPNPLVCRQSGVCDPATGQCVYNVAPDATPCAPFTPDEYCANYTCWSGECLRNCSCGNGRLDWGEDCDPEMQPWKDKENCNATCFIAHTPGKGLSSGAIAGIAVGAVAGVVALAAAGVLAARGAGGAAGAPPGGAGGDPAAGAGVTNPLYASAEGMNNPLFMGQ